LPNAYLTIQNPPGQNLPPAISKIIKIQPQIPDFEDEDPFEYINFGNSQKDNLDQNENLNIEENDQSDVEESFKDKHDLSENKKKEAEKEENESEQINSVKVKELSKESFGNEFKSEKKNKSDLKLSFKDEIIIKDDPNKQEDVKSSEKDGKIELNQDLNKKGDENSEYNKSKNENNESFDKEGENKSEHKIEEKSESNKNKFKSEEKSKESESENPFKLNEDPKEKELIPILNKNLKSFKSNLSINLETQNENKKKNENKSNDQSLEILNPESKAIQDEKSESSKPELPKNQIIIDSDEDPFQQTGPLEFNKNPLETHLNIPGKEKSEQEQSSIGSTLDHRASNMPDTQYVNTEVVNLKSQNIVISSRKGIGLGKDPKSLKNFQGSTYQVSKINEEKKVDIIIFLSDF
jgi:hypothetical protein